MKICLNLELSADFYLFCLGHCRVIFPFEKYLKSLNIEPMNCESEGRLKESIDQEEDQLVVHQTLKMQARKNQSQPGQYSKDHPVKEKSEKGQQESTHQEKCQSGSNKSVKVHSGKALLAKEKINDGWELIFNQKKDQQDQSHKKEYKECQPRKSIPVKDQPVKNKPVKVQPAKDHQTRGSEKKIDPEIESDSVTQFCNKHSFANNGSVLPNSSAITSLSNEIEEGNCCMHHDNIENCLGNANNEAISLKSSYTM